MPLGWSLKWCDVLPLDARRYYEGGASSVYFWELDGVANGFAACILFKKTVEAGKKGLQARHALEWRGMACHELSSHAKSWSGMRVARREAPALHASPAPSPHPPRTRALARLPR